MLLLTTRRQAEHVQDAVQLSTQLCCSSKGCLTTNIDAADQLLLCPRFCNKVVILFCTVIISSHTIAVTCQGISPERQSVMNKAEYACMFP